MVQNRSEPTLALVHRICHVGQTACGTDYIDQIALNTARELEFQYFIVGKPKGRDHTFVETLTMVEGETLQDNCTYQLLGTPCAEVLRKAKTCIYSDKLVSLFPRDTMLADIRCQSYIGTPIFDPKGTLLGVMAMLDTGSRPDANELQCIIEFIAARVGLELYRIEIDEIARAQQKRELQRQKMLAVGQLTSGIAHDINNVLTCISGTAELIAQSNDNPKTARRLENIVSAVMKANQTLQQVLELAHPRRSSSSSCKLHDAINEAIELIDARDGRQHQHKIVITTHANNDVIGISDSYVQQILVNLFTNAIQAMPDGGVLTIQTKNSKYDQAQLTITDTGAGIPIEVQPRIFEPFFSTKSEMNNNGLGLATVYSLMAAHGGNISFTSTPNQGTTFTLHFALSDRSHQHGLSA